MHFFIAAPVALSPNDPCNASTPLSPHCAALWPHNALREAFETKDSATLWVWYPVADLCALVNAISHCRPEL